MANWHVGFTAFGGPSVQFQTVRAQVDTGRYLERANCETVPRKICNTFKMDR